MIIFSFIMKGKVISNVLAGIAATFILLGSIYFIVSFSITANTFNSMSSDVGKEESMKNYLSLFIPFVIVNFILCTFMGAISCFIHVNSVTANNVTITKELVFKFVITFLPLILLTIYCLILFNLK